MKLEWTGGTASFGIFSATDPAGPWSLLTTTAAQSLTTPRLIEKTIAEIKAERCPKRKGELVTQLQYFRQRAEECQYDMAECVGFETAVKNMQAATDPVTRGKWCEVARRLRERAAN